MTSTCAKRLLLRTGLGDGERKPESRAADRRIIDPDELTVRFDGCLGDGQANTSAGVAISPGEQPENVVSAVGTDSGALVGDVDRDRASGPGSAPITIGVPRGACRWRSQAGW